MEKILKNRKAAVIALCVLTAAQILFIFSNSLQSPQKSSERSALVTELVAPLFEIFLGKGNVTDHFVRKAAHFAEFGALGALLASLSAVLGGKRLKAALCCAAGSLAVAACDELLQFASGRGPSAADVLLDFSGAAAGIAAVLGICALAVFAAGRKKRRAGV